MATPMHWVPGPWPGKLAVSARPRGGDWLPGELTHWRAAGIDTVVSLLTPEEERELDLERESSEALANGMTFLSHPILDREVPSSESAFHQTLDRIESRLSSGKDVLIHCRQGIGRTGLVAACLLIRTGLDEPAVIRTVGLARGVPVPETPEQRRWIERYAQSAVLAQ